MHSTEQLNQQSARREVRRQVERAHSAGLLVGILAFTGILAALTHTSVIPLVSELPALLHTSSANTSWAVTATLLTAAITTPINGRLGDLYGKRRMLLICIVFMIVGSVVCALATHVLVMVLGRALQGVATSVIPLGISILRDELPADRVPGAIALISATLGVGGAVGLPISAFLAQHASWHAAFWGVGGVAVLAFVLVLIFLPESPVQSHARFDLPGTIGLTVVLVALFLAILRGGVWGWLSPMTLGLFLLALLGGLLWGWYELRSDHPVVDLRVSARRPVLLTNATSVLAGFAMFGQGLAIPQILQTPSSTGFGLGQSMVAAGMAVIPGGVLMMAVAPFAGRFSRRFGARTMLVVGLAVIAVAYLFGITQMTEVWQLSVMSGIAGAGTGFAYAAMPSLIMSSVPEEESAAANGLNALMRSFGTTSASAVVALVLSGLTVSVGGMSFPTEEGFRLVFVIAGSAAVLGALVALSIPKGTGRGVEHLGH